MTQWDCYPHFTRDNWNIECLVICPGSLMWYVLECNSDSGNVVTDCAKSVCCYAYEEVRLVLDFSSVALKKLEDR